MKKLLLLFMMTPVLCLMGCNNDDSGKGIDPKNNPLKSIKLTDGEAKVAVRSAYFGMALLKAYNQVYQSADAFVISPLSASYALSMLAEGADGPTQTEIIKALGYEGLAMDDINSMNHKLTSELSTLDKATIMTSANMLWMAEDASAREAYKTSLRNFYDAEVMQTSLRDAVNAVNDWCSKKTNDMIKDFLSDIDSRMRMMLFNALYFKGIWTLPFDAGKTASEQFTNGDGSSKRVQMMNGSARYRFYQDVHFAMATFPYGNGAFAMQVILPTKGETTAECMNHLQKADWNTISQSGRELELTVKMPKLELKTKESLLSTLAALGIKTVFTSNADLSKISDERLYVNDVLQAGVIKIDEKGTEAAAVTEVGMVNEALPERGEFFVDRPFIFLIREQSTGTILFAGRVNKM